MTSVLSSKTSVHKRMFPAGSKSSPGECASTASVPITSRQAGASQKRRSRRVRARRRNKPPPTEINASSDLRSQDSSIAVDGPIGSGKGPCSRMDDEQAQTEVRLKKMCGAVRTLLECLGEDPDREGLLATPSRYAEALLFLTKGYQANIQTIINKALFNEGHNEMIIVRDIEICSLCEHHLLPFTGKMHIGYIPRNTVIGLSKLPRIAEIFSRRLQIQERITREVARTLMDILKPQGVAVVMESSHMCMVMRGVEKTGTMTTTSCVLGCFEEKYKTRSEFLSFIGVKEI